MGTLHRQPAFRLLLHAFDQRSEPWACQKQPSWVSRSGPARSLPAGTEFPRKGTEGPLPVPSPSCCSGLWLPQPAPGSCGFLIGK